MQNIHLYMYVGMMDRLSSSGTDFEPTITIESAGTFISGTLVGACKYLRLFREKLDKSGINSDVQKVFLAPYESDLYTFGKKPPAGWKSVLDELPTLIHLRNVRLFTGSGIKEVDLWQGSLESVTGFSLEPIK